MRILQNPQISRNSLPDSGLSRTLLLSVFSPFTFPSSSTTRRTLAGCESDCRHFWLARVNLDSPGAVLAMQTAAPVKLAFALVSFHDLLRVVAATAAHTLASVSVVGSVVTLTTACARITCYEETKNTLCLYALTLVNMLSSQYSTGVQLNIRLALGCRLPYLRRGCGCSKKESRQDKLNLLGSTLRVDCTSVAASRRNYAAVRRPSQISSIVVSTRCRWEQTCSSASNKTEQCNCQSVHDICTVVSPNLGLPEANETRVSSKASEGGKYLFTLSEQQHFVWDTAFLSTQNDKICWNLGWVAWSPWLRLCQSANNKAVVKS